MLSPKKGIFWTLFLSLTLVVSLATLPACNKSKYGDRKNIGDRSIDDGDGSEDKSGADTGGDGDETAAPGKEVPAPGTATDTDTDDLKVVDGVIIRRGGGDSTVNPTIPSDGKLVSIVPSNISVDLNCGEVDVQTGKKGDCDGTDDGGTVVVASTDNGDQETPIVRLPRGQVPVPTEKKDDVAALPIENPQLDPDPEITTEFVKIPRYGIKWIQFEVANHLDILLVVDTDTKFDFAREYVASSLGSLLKQIPKQYKATNSNKTEQITYNVGVVAGTAGPRSGGLFAYSLVGRATDDRSVYESRNYDNPDKEMPGLLKNKIAALKAVDKINGNLDAHYKGSKGRMGAYSLNQAITKNYNDMRKIHGLLYPADALLVINISNQTDLCDIQSTNVSLMPKDQETKELCNSVTSESLKTKLNTIKMFRPVEVAQINVTATDKPGAKRQIEAGYTAIGIKMTAKLFDVVYFYGARIPRQNPDINSIQVLIDGEISDQQCYFDPDTNFVKITEPGGPAATVDITYTQSSPQHYLDQVAIPGKQGCEVYDSGIPVEEVLNNEVLVEFNRGQDDGQQQVQTDSSTVVQADQDQADQMAQQQVEKQDRDDLRQRHDFDPASEK